RSKRDWSPDVCSSDLKRSGEPPTRCDVLRFPRTDKDQLKACPPTTSSPPSPWRSTPTEPSTKGGHGRSSNTSATPVCKGLWSWRSDERRAREGRQSR